MIEIAIFAMGCFWKPDAFFSSIPGIEKVTVGYTGGTTENPTYNQVCGGTTGHTEAIQIEYNPKKITYEKLLRMFFKEHDPTTLNRQGPDIGEQYRSAIFYHDKNQKQLAEKIKKEYETVKAYSNKIVTQILPAQTFYEAEKYHQQYLKKMNGKS
jgi:peptide-methionine (S)-S-oxide reductase